MTALREQGGDPAKRLQAVLDAYALIHYEHRGSEVAALLHRGDHVAHAERHVRDLIRELLTQGAATGSIRDDVTPDELAAYCVHALSAANGLASKASVRRLVCITLTGLTG